MRNGDDAFQISAEISGRQTILGAEEKAWFLDKPRRSKATWKIWGNTIATLDMRADPQNLPPDLTRPWPCSGSAGFVGGNFGTANVERGEIYDFVRDNELILTNKGVNPFRHFADGYKRDYLARRCIDG